MLKSKIFKGIVFFVMLFVVFIVVNWYSHKKVITKGVSEEYPCFEVTVSDTSSISNKYISIGFIGVDKNGLHATLMEKDGSPFVHIWAEDSDAPVREERPWRIGWNEKQKTFHVIYLSEEPILLSRDLESFKGYRLDQRFDGRAALTTDDGKIVTVVSKWEIVYDKNDEIEADSIPINWTIWHVEDSTGNKEIIDLSSEYSSLDVYSLGTHSVYGHEQVTLDPMHGNSVDYAKSGSITYLGMAVRKLDEILVYSKDLEKGEHKYYHFGGPLNEFSYTNDSVIAYKSHDFRFIETTDTTVTVSFYNNGDGESIGGDYAAGKVVRLNLKNLSAELLSQSILSTNHSSWMGSYDYSTNSFAPGLIKELSFNSVLWFSPRMYTELDNTGKELIRIEASYFCPMVAFRAERFNKDSIDKVINRPRISLSCVGDKLIATSLKEGLYNEMRFFVNDSPYEGKVDAGTMIELEKNFTGKISVMSRFKVERYNFYVDKYSKPIYISEAVCK